MKKIIIVTGLLFCSVIVTSAGRGTASMPPPPESMQHYSVHGHYHRHYHGHYRRYHGHSHGHYHVHNHRGYHHAPHHHHRRPSHPNRYVTAFLNPDAFYRTA